MPDRDDAWLEDFVVDGCAIVRGLVSRAYCERAVAEVRRLVDDQRPLQDWDDAAPGVVNIPFFEDPGRCGLTAQNPILAAVFDEPALRAACAQLFGARRRWDGVRNYYLFVKPYERNAGAVLQPRGHIDYQCQPAPILYRGFVFQVSLVQTEPFGGNLTVWPGTHRQVQKALIEHPDQTFPELFSEVTYQPEAAVEFVAEPGDVIFMHSLAVHNGNACHGSQRRPRMALFCECFQDHWLTEIDPASPHLGPWERSLADNGYYRDDRDNAWFQRQKRIDYLAELDRDGHPLDDKWRTYADWTTLPPAACP